MGKETTQSYYTEEEENEFRFRLEEETKLLKQWIESRYFKNSLLVCGYEMEGWIINDKALPYACSDKLLKNISDPHITPELSKFNFEINGNPFKVDSGLAHHLDQDFRFYWKKCADMAALQKGRVMFIGIYPDLTQVFFGLKQIYPRHRYYAINNRINSLRKEKVRIHITGREELSLDTSSIIHEAETTSLQIHLQVDFAQAKDFYNASLIASPVMSALCANSPYICGKELWDESRIPLFEQVISLEAVQNGRSVSRVGLGHGFIQQCVSELFDHNLLHPVLLPEIIEVKKEKMRHLLLHNGTIWRWNRPIIGFDENGKAHFRIEHRVPSAGPTLVDMQANIVFFIGLLHLIKKNIACNGLHIIFSELEHSFHLASRLGLSCEIKWLDKKIYRIDNLISQKLIPAVWDELNQLSLNCDRTNYLINDVIKNRAASAQNGASWQKKFVNKFGKQFTKLVQCYWENQQEDIPVYQWVV